MKRSFQLIQDGVKYVYDLTHWFTDKEAWALYRFFAFGEAIGWTLLIGAIAYRGFGLPEADSVIAFCGRIHGILFVFYFLFVLITARSMQWGIWRISGALLAGMPPYTSLIYEQIMAFYRKKKAVLVAPPKNLE